jgi:hypothetical protein
MWLPETERVLNILSEEEKIKDYVFIGGSALSYYLNHRLSEDIDLACPDEFLKMDKHIDKIMERLREKGFTTDESAELSVNSASKRDFYVNNVKVTFFASGDDFLKNEKKLLNNNLYIANLDTLIGMKTAVIHHRIVIRDYYDLYVIVKKFGLEKAINEASRLYNKKTVDGKECFIFNKTNFLKYAIDMDSIKEDKMESMLNPKYDINKSDIQHFFEEKIKEYISQTIQKIKEIKENMPAKKDAFTKELNERNNKKGDPKR